LIATTPEIERYLAQYARTERNEPGWLASFRKNAIERFSETGFPTTRNEDWKYTDVRPLAQTAFAPAVFDPRVTVKALEQDALGGVSACRLVFVNGRYAPELSALDRLPRGVKVSRLAAALQADQEIVETHLARYAAWDRHAFVALNTALFEDGAFVHVGRGAVIEEPIHLLFVSTGEGAAHPRSLVIAEENSQATLIESYVGPDGGTYFTNAVTEIVCAQNAVLDHYKAGLESGQAFHIATMQAQIGRDAGFASHNITLDGGFVRNDIHAVLGGEGVEATLNGLYVLNGRQHVDNHMLVDHAMPHCASHELYKGIMDERATGVFHGKILVRQDAQKTDAKQTNQNLLLSEEAVINTRPQLMIYADDVRCTHGATVGQLDAQAIFYMRSRGIGPEEARAMLIRAFARDILDRVKVAPLREALEARLHKRLQG
jgi:Fe-S cluster assembly protein SufD